MNGKLLSTKRLDDGNTLRMFLGTNESETELRIFIVLDDYSFDMPLMIWNDIARDFATEIMAMCEQFKAKDPTNIFPRMKALLKEINKEIESDKEIEDREKEE